MNVLTSLQNFIAAADAVTLDQLGTDGQAVVTDAVNSAEALTGTGEEKFATAIAKCGTDLVTLGKDVSEYILKLAIETAVTKLRSAVPAETPVDPAAAVDPVA